MSKLVNLTVNRFIMGTVVAPRAKKEKTSKIPDCLIYEIVKGRPVYYKGYKDVLNGTKTLEELKMESILQSWLKARITMILGAAMLEKGFEMTTGELGLNLPEQNKRGADISFFRSEELELKESFSDLSPEIIIEIDVKADTGKHSEMEYVLEKIEDYQDFGVQKIIWIFTKTQNIIIADSSRPRITENWDKDVEVVESISFNLNKILGERKSALSK